MFDLYTAKPGDILLFKPKGFDPIGTLISFFSAGGKYSHAAFYIGDGRIIESHLKTGVVETVVKKKYYESCDVFRVPNLRQSQYKKVLKWHQEKIGSGYDLSAFPATFVHSVMGKLLFWKKLRQSKPILNNPDNFYCSELNASGFYHAGVVIAPKVYHMNCTPSDIGRSKALYKVS